MLKEIGVLDESGNVDGNRLIEAIRAEAAGKVHRLANAAVEAFDPDQELHGLYSRYGLSGNETDEELAAKIVTVNSTQIPPDTGVNGQKTSKNAQNSNQLGIEGEVEQEFFQTQAAQFETTPEELAKEFAQTQARYEGTDQWQKAPNGRPSNLNPQQWVMVRTPRFKAWFGDWEGAARQKAEEHRGIEAIKKAIAGEDVENAMFRPGIGEISFLAGDEKSGIRHLVSRRNAEGKNGEEIARLMPGVIANGEVIRIQGEGSGGDRIHIAHEGHTALLSLYYKGDKKAWLLSGWDNEEGGNAGVTPNNSYASNALGISHGKGASSPAIEALNAHVVKPGQVSQVIDENGEPLVMYHGTKADFEAFQASEPAGGLIFATPIPEIANRYAIDGGGYITPFISAEAKAEVQVFLKDYPNPTTEDIQEYGGELPPSIQTVDHLNEFLEYASSEGANVLPVYVKLAAAKGTPRNPIRWEEAERIGAAGLAAENFDGAWVTEQGGVAVAVASPTQIKSATGNSGNFNPQDPRILYQNQPPVAVLTGKELGDWGGDIKALRKAAIAYYKQELQGGKPAISKDIGEVGFTRKGMDKFNITSANENKIRLIPAVRQIIENGEYKGRKELSKERNDGIVAFHWFEGNVSLDNKDYRAGVMVYEDNHGNKFYNINDVTKEKALHLTQRNELGGEGPSEETSYSQTLPQTPDEINLEVRPLNQAGQTRPTPQAPQGSIIFKDGKATINFFRTANASTFIHEFGHFTLEDLRRRAFLPGAHDSVSMDWLAVRDYLGLDETHDNPQTPIPTEAHEKWAKTHEAYFREGKSPSLKMSRSSTMTDLPKISLESHRYLFGNPDS